MRETLTRRRKIVTEAFDEMGFVYGVPQGGQFIFADARQRSSARWSCAAGHRRGAGADRAGALVRGALENYVRVTFLQPEAVLTEGMERLKRVVARAKRS